MSASILDEIIAASETVESVNVVVYGDSGSGKTTFAGSGADNGANILILAIEDGITAIARGDNKTQVLPVTDWRKLLQAISYIEKNPKRWDWVVLDSATHLQHRIIWKSIIDEAKKKNPNRSEFKRELQEYNIAQNMFKHVIDRLFDSDANVLILAGSELAEDEEGETFRRPDIEGKKGGMSEWLARRAMIVGYLSVVDLKGKQVRKLEFARTPQVVAKDRTGTFVKPLGNPTLERFTQALVANSQK